MRRYCILLIFFVWPSVALAQQAGNPMYENAAFMAAADMARLQIASDVNLLGSHLANLDSKNQNITLGSEAKFDDLEKDCYRRALSGMTIVGYYYERDSVSHTLFYNPSYDVGIIAEWATPRADKPQLKKLFLASGELLRDAPVKLLAPGWIERGDLVGMVEAYKKVHARAHDLGMTATLANTEIPHFWKLSSGQQLADRMVVHERIMAVGATLLSFAVASARNQLSARDVATLRAVKPAVDAASDLQGCLEAGGTVETVLQCELSKRRFKMTSLPKVVSDEGRLKLFLGTTFVEGAMPVGRVGMAFVASYSPANNFRFILTTVDGEPSAITLVDFDAQ